MGMRPYQTDGIAQVRAHFAADQRKVLLHLATGAGKTHVFCHVMTAAAARGKRSAMFVRGRKLVDQASKRLFRENTPHGVLMANHWNHAPGRTIQICSIDTLIAQGLRPPADLIVIDEAHQATSKGYVEVLKDYPNAFILAVTATPYCKKSMRHFADVIVHPITVRELIEMGHLVPPRYYAPADPNLRGVKVSKSTGDYAQDELAAAMDKSSITGDILTHWEKLAYGRPTICFAVSVEHSRHIAAQFCEAGIPAAHCDADTPDEERDRIIARLIRGELKLVSNVGILCTGVDIPPASCIIMARPTLSYPLYVQQAGRGTRPYPGKDDFLLLDHAGNVVRHGFIDEEPEPDLDGLAKKSLKINRRPKRCLECFWIGEVWPCEDCGWSPPAEPRGERTILEVAGELKEIKPTSELERYEAQAYCQERLDFHMERKRSPWRAYYDTEAKFGGPAAKLVFFRLCKTHGIDVHKKKKETEHGFPFK